MTFRENLKYNFEGNMYLQLFYFYHFDLKGHLQGQIKLLRFYDCFDLKGHLQG